MDSIDNLQWLVMMAQGYKQSMHIEDCYNSLLKDLEVLNLLKSLCKNEQNWVNTSYGDGNKLYIDGYLDYKNEDEKNLIKEWLKDNKDESKGI